eukprot:TRINITY_DN38708_c0_g1_i1.p1 TRINITY_DN38708_c0_g1~~TRINITY_DN38708_c0_g1_i1.p1  ORF type:complete len:121 (-),score=40.13 TRINITY_DN38708_c0_g1_i1:21-383(-)
MWGYGDFFRFFFFQAEDGIRDVERSRGLGDVYKRQVSTQSTWESGIQYEGEFRKGKKHGRGIKRTPSGVVVTGTWINDLEDGIMIIKNGDESVIKTKWSKGMQLQNPRENLSNFIKQKFP